MPGLHTYAIPLQCHKIMWPMTSEPQDIGNTIETGKMSKFTGIVNNFTLKNQLNQLQY